MNILLTAGHPNSGYLLAHEALVSAGLGKAQFSRHDSISTEKLSENIFTAHGRDPEGFEVWEQIYPEKVWHDLAADLLMGTPDERSWGWSDARTVSLLEFWKAFDSRIRFVLIYCAPEFALANMLRGKLPTSESVTQLTGSWIECNKQILRFYNRNLDRCLLINASSVTHAPTQFVEKTDGTFGLMLDQVVPKIEVHQVAVSAIASSLAKLMIEDYDEAIELYRELESSSDVATANSYASQIEKRHAWYEYVDLLEKTRETADEACKHSERAYRLQQECEKAEYAQAKLVEQLVTKNAESVQLLESERTGAVALRHLDEQVAKNGEEQSVGEGGRETEMAQLQFKSAALYRENELLLLQLHQLQEELEHYVKKCDERAVTGNDKADYDGFRNRPQEGLQPVEFVFEMSRDIDGNNWYYAEHDGRWAGPGKVSSVTLPSLRRGQYELQLDIVDAMEPLILYDMEVSLNGTPLEISRDWEGFPALVHARFSTEEVAQKPTWELQFKFPMVVSPAQYGADDKRSMAIRLRTIKLTAI